MRKVTLANLCISAKNCKALRISGGALKDPSLGGFFPNPVRVSRVRDPGGGAICAARRTEFLTLALAGANSFAAVA